MAIIPAALQQQNPEILIGGDNGADAVARARLVAILLPPQDEARDEEEMERLRQLEENLNDIEDEAEVNSENVEKDVELNLIDHPFDGGLFLNKHVYNTIKPDVPVSSDDESLDPAPQLINKSKMAQLLTDWWVNSVTLRQCNLEHLAAISVCVLSLASSMSGAGRDPVSLVIQGSGGTGKSKSVIAAVKDFVNFVCEQMHSESHQKQLLVAAPTNLVALDIGGCTLDSGLLNRRNLKLTAYAASMFGCL